eukprot:1790780-Rhodomonas_salina.1
MPDSKVRGISAGCAVTGAFGHEDRAARVCSFPPAVLIADVGRETRSQSAQQTPSGTHPVDANPRGVGTNARS